MAKIAILTNFKTLDPKYSLTGIVKDQATMLSSKGHEVLLYVDEGYKHDSFPAPVELLKRIPSGKLVDYHSKADISSDHQKLVEKTATTLRGDFKDRGVEFAFVHDFCFTGWNLPYGLACQAAGYLLKDVRWFHWVHSIPTMRYDWWDWALYGRTQKLVYPNRANRVLVAESFRTTINDVKIIPHIKDIRSWFDFQEDSWKLTRIYPKLLSADVVEVLPASGDRLQAKRVYEVIQIFANIKKMGKSVCLFIANQWSTRQEHHDNVDFYYKEASRFGLIPNEEVIFSSEILDRKYQAGLPKEILRDLMTCMNLFIFPTREETFGLALPEAALSSGAFCVLNASLKMQAEISDYAALEYPFGSFENQVTHSDDAAFFRDVAFGTIGRMDENESCVIRTKFRQKNNMDHLYDAFYAPALAESRLWI
jgi:hypothetical protein